ncbi:hypothetical protein GDO81_018353 [Engystomops pustulosus]|uniref:Vomeronasal type-1 receptor n=1 Tax=Engystomops pustulosus TaxID=76066 RepID=A0AAV7A6A9_ENGPU|nr:hypothetical protein GDO81_018353 [Engystomops pustulosus]
MLWELRLCSFLPDLCVSLATDNKHVCSLTHHINTRIHLFGSVLSLYLLGMWDLFLTLGPTPSYLIHRPTHPPVTNLNGINQDQASPPSPGMVCSILPCTRQVTGSVVMGATNVEEVLVFSFDLSLHREEKKFFTTLFSAW